MLVKKEFILVIAGDDYKMLMKRRSCTADCIYCHDFFQCRQIFLPDPNDTTKLTNLETVCNSYPGYVPIFARKKKKESIRRLLYFYHFNIFRLSIFSPVPDIFFGSRTNAISKSESLVI